MATETSTVDELRAIIFDTRETKSVVDRLIHGLHPFTALLIVPVFALANTGVGISGAALVDGLTSSVGVAIILGLVVGKPLGITVASWIAVKAGLAVLPANTTWPQVVGVGMLGGIGFTVSLFITDLAFDNQATVDNAKIAVLTASVLASAVGAGLLVKATSPVPSETAADAPGDELGPITFGELNQTSPDAFIAPGSSVEENVAADQQG